MGKIVVDHVVVIVEIGAATDAALVGDAERNSSRPLIDFRP
jgi:hypothetical protein